VWAWTAATEAPSFALSCRQHLVGQRAFNLAQQRVAAFAGFHVSAVEAERRLGNVLVKAPQRNPMVDADDLVPAGSIGLNFFIPIDDALRALSLSPAG
jgi:hypothetical protein